MKKLFFFAVAMVFSFAVRAEVKTLDLAHPTNPSSFSFTADGIWTETYNETEYDYIESQIFGFCHLPSHQSWYGSSYEGFTVSTAAVDVMPYGYYANMAKGGIAGEGTPYMVGYFSEYWLTAEANEDMMSSTHIIFNDGNAYYPRYVYLNNMQTGFTCVSVGNGFARPFHQGDKFEVWIDGLDEDYYPNGDKIIYRLADFTSENPDEWFVNTEWAKVDLSELGECYGLTFTVVSTDQSAYGTNTSQYFALDGLTVSTTADEALGTLPEPAPHVAPASYTRTDLTVGNYGTVCLPRNVAEGNYTGAEFYKVVGREKYWITLEEVTDLVAGEAYIFKATATEINCTYSGAEVRVPAAATENNILQGVFAANVVPYGNYFLNENKLYQSDGNQYVDPNRAWLSNLTPAAVQPVPGRRRITMPIQDLPTDIINTNADNTQTVKMMQNGVIYIQKNGYIYNIQGQIVK